MAECATDIGHGALIVSRCWSNAQAPTVAYVMLSRRHQEVFVSCARMCGSSSTYTHPPQPLSAPIPLRLTRPSPIHTNTNIIAVTDVKEVL
jgi:hypothetical protein